MSGEDELPIDNPTNPGGNLGWLSDLKPLVPYVGTLVTVASNPTEWLRVHVFVLIAEWFVRKIIGLVQYVLGWFLFAVERVASIILDAAGPLGTPIESVGDAAVGAIEGTYAVVYGLATSAGLAAPVAAAFAVGAIGAMLAALGYGAFQLIPGSDAVEGGLRALR